MHNKQACAAKGDYGNRGRHQFIRSMQRAAVNIYKTENSFEMLVFAPGRVKEHFTINVKGNTLVVGYVPPSGYPTVDWVSREYSRGGFERTFTLDETFDTANISAKYEAGVLQVSLPLIPGSTPTERVIVVN